MSAIIPKVVEQHAEQAGFLWLLRDDAVSAPHYSLGHLAKLDDRVEAHLDGLRIANSAGWQIVLDQLAAREPGEAFAAAALAVASSVADRLDSELEALDSPELARGVVS